MTTKIAKEEFLRLSRLMEKDNPKKEEFRFKIILRKKYIPKIKKNIIQGSRRHNQIAHYIEKKFRERGFKIYNESRIYLNKINKVYVIDLIAIKDNYKVLIECGKVPKIKLNNLKKYYGGEVLHISYLDFNIIQSNVIIQKRIKSFITKNKIITKKE